MNLRELTKNLKILYVEDSMMMRNITHKLLKPYFDYIDIAKNGKDGLELYKNFYDKNKSSYDIVITDLEMPIMNGEELSRHILKLNYTQDIIVLSAVEDFKKIINLINIGVKKFIAKPIQEEQLNNVLQDVYQNIKIKEAEEQEKNEVEEHNKVLKQREDKYQKILQEKIKELEEFSSALNNSDIVLKADLRGIITYVNNHYCDISKYTREELIGKKVSLVNGGNRPKQYFQKLWNTIQNKKRYTMLIENKTKDGNNFYMKTTINPILNIEGNIVEFIAVSHDMTQLIKSLEEANLLQKAKEDFFVNMSHEMKTPLNSILGFSSLLKKRLKDDKKSLLMVNTIYETGIDLNNLIESISEIRKIQDNSLEIKEIEFKPHDKLSKCLTKHVEQANDKNQKYKIFIDQKIPEKLFGDSFRITQVIDIVVNNAIKFTQDEGTIKVHISYDDVQEYLICLVKDNGIGIAIENIDKIFNMQQLDSDINRAHEGAGLSLNIANKLIKIMNGNIKVESILSKGSIFKLKFLLKKVDSNANFCI